ncbi:MAG TPA: hypothetical protein VKM54_22265 [Myxococcota bacterium]|nr:hypothetical protein [Myxococcota bacterium]
MTSQWQDASAAVEGVREQVIRRPYLTLGLAVGIGYLVGRGVSMSVLTTLLGVSARAAVGSAVESFLRDASAPADRKSSRKKEDRSHAPGHREEYFVP